MLKSKSALFISFLFATQLAAAGGVILEKQEIPPFDKTPDGSVILECQPDSGTVILEKGIILQKKVAGSVILQNTPVNHYAGGQILEHDGGELLSGGMILERGIILQKNQVAGGMILENTLRQDAAIVVHDGSVNSRGIIERSENIMEDLDLAGGLIIDRHGKTSDQLINV